MKTITKNYVTFCLGAILMFLFSFTTSAQNLVTNAGFETWTSGKADGWFGSKTQFTADSALQYTASVHGGTSACQLINPSTSHKRYTTQPISVVNGQTYTIKFWVRGNGDIRTGLFDGRTAGSGYATYNSYITVNATDWTQQTQTIAAANTSSAAEFVFSVRSTTGTHIQIDDVEITGPSSSTPTLNVSPLSISFGQVAPNQTSSAQTVTISGANLTGPISYVKGGTDASAYTITESTWNANTGGTLSVTFKPTAEQTYNATIIVSSTGVDNDTVKLSGTGGSVAPGFICNGGFETWTSGKADCWFGSKTQFAVDSALQYTSSVHGGTSACQLINPSATHKRYTTQPVSVINGQTYTIKFWVRGNGDIRTAIFDGRTGTGYSSYNSYITVNSTDWTQQTQTIDAANTSSAAEFIFSVKSTTGNHIQIDDVEIFVSTTPTLNVSPLTLSFGEIVPNQTSAAQNVAISGVNLTGNITYTKGGTDASAFTITESSWSATTGGTLSVTFKPTAEKAYNATIVVGSTGAENDTVRLSGAGSASPDFICNGGFELWTSNKPDCWYGAKTNFGADSIRQATTNVHGGSSACQLINVNSGHKRFTSKAVNIVNGQEYTVSFYARGAGDIRTGLYDGDDAASDFGFAYNAYIPVTSTWTKYTQTITANNTSGVAEFIFSVKSTSGDHIVIDDVEITTGAIALTADFSADKTAASPNTVITFTDKSTGNPVAWQWTVSGADNFTSTQQNPSFTFTKAGNYTVKLVASTEEDSDEIIKTNYIKIGNYLVYQDFDNKQWNGWTPVSVKGEQVWIIEEFNGDSYAKMNGFSGSSLENEDWLISPAFELTEGNKAVLTFKNAKSSHEGPALELYFSNDSINWIPLSFTKSTGAYAWTESGDISLSEFVGEKCYIAFKYTSTNTASCIWEVDNIIIEDRSGSGIENIATTTHYNVYPNPSKGLFTVEVANPVSAKVYSVNGLLMKEVKIDSKGSIDLTNAPKGIYFLNINNTVKKLIVK